MSEQDAVVSGVAAGVPYVALPPASGRGGQVPAPLVIAWHLNDPPRSAAAMAAALPLAGVTAWRVYLDLPMHGKRQLPGGLEEFMRLGYQDAYSAVGKSVAGSTVIKQDPSAGTTLVRARPTARE